MSASKEWRRLIETEEAWTAGQRWYCPCYTKYKAGFGVIVQVQKGHSTYYMKAECPDWTTLDVRALKHQKEYGNISAAELYARLPIVRPAVTELVVPHRWYANTFQFRSEEEFDELPTFEWDDIFRFASGR